jgi:prefoldin subunit 5
MQGDIRVKSDSGIGTKVFLKLPLQVVSSSAEDEKIQTAHELDEQSYEANLQYLDRESLNLDQLMEKIQECIGSLSNGESIDDQFEEMQVDLAVVSSKKIAAQIKNHLDSFSYELAEEKFKNIYEQLKNELQSKGVA